MEGDEAKETLGGSVRLDSAPRPTDQVREDRFCMVRLTFAKRDKFDAFPAVKAQQEAITRSLQLGCQGKPLEVSSIQRPINGPL